MVCVELVTHFDRIAKQMMSCHLMLVIIVALVHSHQKLEDKKNIYLMSVAHDSQWEVPTRTLLEVSGSQILFESRHLPPLRRNVERNENAVHSTEDCGRLRNLWIFSPWIRRVNWRHPEQCQDCTCYLHRERTLKEGGACSQQGQEQQRKYIKTEILDYGVL